ncbi:O-antigen translocase [Sphingomonas sp. LHG3406-1]|uniref:O-antigen translocase n=1 Tax=Sphingomonas sp. LHG3406-1 TaxID=2804617 RepID=UPI00260CE596|nr:O-antigen translocase [Sphingomonas sp. LHG3406-1]
MSEAGSSHRRILAATALIGSASVVNVGFGIVRMKVAALILGAAGVGLIGLMQSLVSFAGSVGGLGTQQSAMRQVAAGRADGGRDGEAAVRAALLRVTIACALAAGLLVWLLRATIAQQLFGDPSLARTVGWMAPGVALTIVAGSQTALLAGLGRVADVARTTVLGAILATIAGVALLFVWREQAIIPYLLVAPGATVLASWYFTFRIERHRALPGRWRQQAALLVRLGVATLASALILQGAQLAVRGILNAKLGLADVGLFQAAYVLSSTYIAFVLQAMSSDYYPRLSAAIGKPDEAVRLVNEQTEVTLLLAGPFVLALLGLAPLVLNLLYSSEFAAAAAALRWQILADVLRLASWPLGFALLAAARGRLFVSLEVIAALVLIGVCAWLVPSLGIVAPGIAMTIMYAVYLPLVFVAVRRTLPLRWSRAVVRIFALLCGTSLLAFTAAASSEWAGAIIGTLLAAIWAAVAYRRLSGQLRKLPA